MARVMTSGVPVGADAEHAAGSARPIRRILIVGGGTAGWFSAAFLASTLDRTDGEACEITLVEASDIPTVGVGEATIPPIVQFFQRLGVPEGELMQACQATFKLGIRYPGWSAAGQDSDFYHPFFIGGTSRLLDFSNLWLWKQFNGQTKVPYAEACHVATRFAQARKAPKLPGSGSYEAPVPYAYHLDAGLMADYLKRQYRHRIRHVIDAVTDVALAPDGSIAHVNTAGHGKLAADLFIDCSGFQGLLINKTLEEPFVSYHDCLLNDRALAAQVPYLPGTPRDPYTTARAMASGWTWDIPLYHRRGVGYVYSSQFISDDAAELEFRQHLGAAADGIEFKRIRMRVGRHRRLWVRNCVAVGLAGGFIEPLESTGLDLIQKGLTALLHCFPDRRCEPPLAAVYNDIMGRYYDQIRDFIAMHFCVTTRRDTPFWQACAKDLTLSDHLSGLLEVWREASGRIYLTTGVGGLGEYFGPLSYYCILIGMGYLPKAPPALYDIADFSNLQKEIDAEADKVAQFMRALPGNDAYLDDLHSY